MSDKKSKKSVELEANLAKIANAKPRRRSRKDNIYERFITRVENVDNIDGDTEIDSVNAKKGGSSALKPLKNADKLSSYEPLSAAELELFASQQDESRDERRGVTGVDIDFDDDNLTEVIDKNRTDSLPNNADSASKHKDIDSFARESVNSSTRSVGTSDPLTSNPNSKNTQPASSRKPLIIGIVLGSLFIAAVVLALIFTGVLSTAAKPARDKVTTDKVTASNPSSAVANDSSTNPAANDGKKSATASKASSANTDTSTANEKSTKPVKSAKQESANQSETEPAITYEDFREESQNTLYRETND